MSLIDDLESAARTVADRVGPATVTIGRDGRGNGVVLAAGKVLTNAHLLRDRTTQVTFADGRVAQGSVAGADRDGDLVVLTVDTGTVAPVPLADATPEPGAVVFAAARGPHGLRVTPGMVSAADQAFRGPRGRRVEGALEHTAPMARGSSGGPLADRAGNVVGLNTHRLGDGLYLARPFDDALRARVADLADGRSVTTLRLGVALAPAAVAARLRRAVGLPERDGLLVRGVDADGPGGRAGLREGDLLVRAAGRALVTPDDLAVVLDAHDPGSALELLVVRGVDELGVAVRFSGADEAAPEAGAPAGS